MGRRWGAMGGGGGLQRPPLPSNAIEYWHSELGVTPGTNIRGQLQGWQVFYQNAPTIAPDPGFFNGRQVMQSTAAGTKRFSNGSAFTVYPDATRPYLYCIGRFRTVPAADQIMVGAGVHFAADRFLIGANAAGQVRGGFNAAFTVDGAASTAVHRFDAWMDGTNRVVRVDGQQSVTADTGTLGTSNAIGFGCGGGLGTGVPDASIAFVLICASKPSDQEIAALDTWARAYWGLGQQVPPLPVTAVEFWHGELGASSGAAVGQLQGLSLTGQNTPVVAVDSANFNGRAVYQADATGNKCWFNSALGAVLPFGTRPYLYIIGRHRVTSPASEHDLFCIGRVGISNETNIYLTSGNVRQILMLAGTTSNGTGDTGVHRFEAWKDGTNRNFRIDGANATSADVSATSQNIQSIGLGTNSGSVANVGSVSVAFALLCSAKPSDDEIAVLDQWAQQYWAAP